MTPSLASPVKSGVRVGSGPLIAYIASYRAKLESLGYVPTQVVYHLRFFAKLDLWLLRRKQRLRWLNEEKVGQFLAQLRHKLPAGYRGARSGLRLLLGFLRDIGVVAPKSEPIASSPSQRLADRYRAFLKEERGLDDATIYNYSRHIDQFLTEQFGTGPVELRAFGTSQITAFVRRHAPRGGRGLAAQMLTGLRSFFRFARFRKLTAADLAVVVPAVPGWEISGPPKHLPTEAVQRVLASCERSTVRGKRDYAVLLMLARLGLRAGEIVALQLDDIDWVNGQLAVRSKKGDGWARLPLPIDVGRALAGYLKVRPPSPHRNVFVRGYAPYTPFSASGPVSVLARKAIEKAHVKSARTGAHVFRHSLATEMLRRGASLDEIGRVLRHRDPDSTAIYAKVDLGALRELALPWPGGAR
jgi:integrase